MFESIKKLFFGPKIDFQELMNQGAIIIDVRTKGEYQSGHIKGSKNIPLQSLQLELKNIPKNKAIITCCAGGMRSASAKKLLNSKGYPETYNGGGWMRLESKIS